MVRPMANEWNSRFGIIIFGVFLFFVLCYLVSPLLSFYLLLLFISFVDLWEFRFRLLFSSLIIISGSTIYASRMVGLSLGDDFYYVYMPVYHAIQSGQPVFNGYYSSGVEFLLPVLFKVISFFDVNVFSSSLTYSNLIFTFTSLFSFLFYIWLERFVLPHVPSHKTLCLASALLFLNFFLMGYMVRQAFSTVFVLFALGYFGELKYKKAVFFSLVAIFTHLSAIPIIAIFYTFMYGRNTLKYVVLAIIAILSLMFSVVKSYIISSGLLGVATYKLDYYNQDISDSGHGYIFHVILLMTLAFFLMRDRYSSYRSLLLFGGISYLLLLPIPLASDRMLMPLTSFMLGAVIFLASGKYSSLLKYAFIPYCVIRFLRYGPMYHGAGVDSYFLWHFYPWFGGFLG